MIFVFILIIVLLIAFGKDSGILTLEKSNMLKAFFPYMIILHHLSQQTGYLPDFRWAGPYFVGIFFFISGYGLEYKHSNKQLSMYSFFIRIKNVLLPIIVPLVFFLLLLSFRGINIGEYAIGQLKFFSFVLPYTWFVLTLIVLYISFYFLSSFFHGIKLFASEFIFLIVFSYVMMKNQMEGTTYITTYCFLAGAMYHYWEKAINEIQKKFYFVSIIFTIFVFTTYISLYSPPFKGYAALGALMWTVCFIILYTKICIKYNILLDHLKSISYDVYLWQGVVFYFLKEVLGSGTGISFICMSVVFSIVFGEFSFFIRKFVKFTI